MNKNFNIIQRYIESDDIKYPCLEISSTVAIPQYNEFDIDDLFVCDTQITLLDELNKTSFNSNYHVRTLLIAIYMISKYNNNNKNIKTTMLNKGPKNINDKLKILFPNLTIYDEDVIDEYTFILSTNKNKYDIDIKKFKYGAFILPIFENENFTFFSGALLSIPFVDSSESLIGVIVNFSTTQVIMYDTTLLKTCITNNKHKQLFCKYYNPFLGMVLCDLKPNLPCNYNNMYLLTIVRLYLNGFDNNFSKRINISENVETIFKYINIIFNNEHKVEILPTIKSLDNKTNKFITHNSVSNISDVSYTDCSPLQTMNYIINNSCEFTPIIFVFHSESFIRKLHISSNIISINKFQNKALENMYNIMRPEIDVKKDREDINNSPFVLMTYTKLKNILYDLLYKYILVSNNEVNYSLRFCNNIVFCNAEYINTESFACMAVYNNLKTHNAILPNLILQTNGTISNDIPYINLKSSFTKTYITYTHSVPETVLLINEKINIHKESLATTGARIINIKNLSKIYTSLFGATETTVKFNNINNENISENKDIIYLGFLNNNTLYNNTLPHYTITIDYNKALSNIYDIKNLAAQLLKYNIQIIELDFISRESKLKLLNSVNEYIIQTPTNIVKSIKLTKLNKSIYVMKEPFESGFNLAIKYNISIFTYCLFTAIYQDYENFVDWNKISNILKVKNITLYEMNMVKNYIIDCKHKFGICPYLETYCIKNNLDITVMNHILHKLVNFNNIKHGSNDQQYNFEDFLKKIVDYKILGIEPIVAGVMNTKDNCIYEIPNYKNFITYNKIIPISSTTVKMSATMDISSKKILNSFITVPN